MHKRIVLCLMCLVFVALLGVVCFASTHGLFEGYPIVKVVVNGQEVRGDVPAISFKGRTMVPVRFVSEALGAEVTWDAASATVRISTGQTGTPAAEESASGKAEYTVRDETGKPLYGFTINKVTEMSERNAYSDKNPAQVIVIHYTYTNVSNEEDVYLSDIFFKVVDSTGKIGYTYPNTPTDYPQSVPISVTCTAQMIFGLDNKSNVVTLYFYRNMFGQATATFEIAVE